jgi:hypothetical protein
MLENRRTFCIRHDYSIVRGRLKMNYSTCTQYLSKQLNFQQQILAGKGLEGLIFFRHNICSETVEDAIPF